MKQRFFISTIVASLIMGTLSLSADEEKATATTINPSTQNQNSKKLLRIKKSVGQEVKAQKENFKRASKEIIDGLNKTFLATRALENNKIDKAKKALKESIKLFDTALKAEPKLGVISIAQEMSINMFNGDARELQSYLDTTIKMLKNHETQEARAMLLPLEDEMVIVTQRLPIDEYLVSTKEALKLLDKKKNQNALSTLAIGMSLMEVDTVVIPIPLMVAEDLIIDASVIDKSKKEEAQKLLTMAQDELKKAVLLGYTQKYSPEYKLLSESISEIQKEIKGKNIVEKLYDKLKENFHTLMNKSRDDVVKKTAKDRVREYQDMEEKKAMEERPTFIKDAKADENKTIK